MIKAILKRMRSGDEGTFGTLLLRDGARELTLYTAELPWRENAVGKSCIPLGKYTARLSPSPRFRRDLYELEGVPGRSEILIHRGNWAGDASKGKLSEVKGCILVGMAHGILKGQRAVVQSATALAALHKFTGGEALELEVM